MSGTRCQPIFTLGPDVLARLTAIDQTRIAQALPAKQGQEKPAMAASWSVRVDRLTFLAALFLGRIGQGPGDLVHRGCGAQLRTTQRGFSNGFLRQFASHVGGSTGHF